MTFKTELLAAPCVLLAWAVAAPATAQATSASAPTATVATPRVSEVIVTAAPFAVSAEGLTSHVDVLTREQLDVAPPAGLGDLLNGLPGVRSTSFAPGASRPVIRGLTGPRVLVLQNGVGQIDVSDVSPDHAVASDPAEASRIEILRGPSTLLYGGSGIGGVVNVIDDRVASRRVDGVTGRLGGSYSTVDDGYGVGGAVKAGAGNWVVSLVGQRRESSDYDIPVPALSRRLQAATGGVADPGKTLRNTGVEQFTVGGGVSYVSDWGFLGASVRRLESQYGIPYAQILGEPPGGEEGPVFLDLGQTRVDVRGEVKLPGDALFDRIRFSSGWAEYEHREIGRLTGSVNTTFQSDGGEGRIELVQRDRGAWQGAVGVNGLHRSFAALGDEAFVPSTDIGRTGVFTLQRYDRGAWGVEGGLRVDYARLDTSLAGGFPILSDLLGGADRAKRDFTTVSGSAAAFVRPAPNWFLSINYAHNARAPNEVELFANGPHAGTGAFEIGNPNLKSEQVNSVEGTARYTGDRFRAEAHAYSARYDSYVEESATGHVDPDEGLPVFVFTGVDARFYGFELEGSWTAWRSGAREVRLESTFDYVNARGDNGPIARIPPYSVVGRVAYADPRVDARLEVRHVDQQDRVTAFELPTDDYTTLNAFASYKPFADKGLKLYVDARNLTEEETREHASFLKDIAPGPGRNIRLGAALSF